MAPLCRSHPAKTLIVKDAFLFFFFAILSLKSQNKADPVLWNQQKKSP